MLKVFTTCVLLYSLLTWEAQATSQLEKKHFKERFRNYLSQSSDPDPHGASHLWGQHQFKIKELKWENCGSPQDPLQVHELDITPDVLHFPENLTLAYRASLNTSLSAPIKVKLSLRRKFGPTWIKVPCYKNVGSCVYPDLCRLVDELRIKLPPSLKCPFKAGAHNESGINISIPPAKLPSWMLSGKYSAKSDIWSHGKHIGCLKLTLKIK